MCCSGMKELGWLCFCGDDIDILLKVYAYRREDVIINLVCCKFFDIDFNL